MRCPPLPFTLFTLLWLGLSSTPAVGYHWPTPHEAPLRGDDWTQWVQATESGIDSSGLFGCVRNEGRRFHEALDIAPVLERRRGEATDPVFAAADGVVVYVNPTAGDSGYGRYVVVEHRQFSPTLVTLYAHLAGFEEATVAGRVVQAGDTLGTLGRSAGGYRIPPSRAHLHFEIALRLTDDFQPWYDAQSYGSPNQHGIWNGINLTGLDPWDAWLWLRDHEGSDLSDYFRQIEPGFVVELDTVRVPDLVERNPGLLAAPIPSTGVRGWRITFTAWGLPLRFEPMTDPVPGHLYGTTRVVATDASRLEAFACREMVKMANGYARLDERGLRVLELLFGFHESP